MGLSASFARCNDSAGLKFSPIQIKVIGGFERLRGAWAVDLPFPAGDTNHPLRLSASGHSSRIVIVVQQGVGNQR